MRTLVLFLLLGFICTSCQYAPQPGYADLPEVVAKRNTLMQELLAFLPAEEQSLPGARREARWLADTAYKAAAGIATINDPLMPGWLHNRMVNSSFNLRERGLCWHYQHDMYRELRRRKLQFFRIGCCVRDRGKGSEHNCVYLTGASVEWPHVVILDAWRHNGRLKVMSESDFADDDWEDSESTAAFLASVYPESHQYPIEHWAQVKSGKGWRDYISSRTPEGAASRQGQLMQKNMREGVRARGGKFTNY